MITSRCGVRCEECARKEAVHCKGCTHMEKPFWGGKCPVKSCCEGKNLLFCGECPEFPCSVLSHMGVDQGFDPAPKIAQCRAWRKEQVKE